MTSKNRFMAVIGVLIASLVLCVGAEATGPTRQGSSPNQGLAAINKASKAGKYLFIFFYRTADESTKAMGLVYNKAVARCGGKVDSAVVQITDPTERGIIHKFGADRAPMPLVLVMAPNGAITGSFQSSCTEDQLLQSLVIPSETKVLKALQGGKLVLLCAQNGYTKFNSEAMQGVMSFKADKRYSQATEIVRLDPGHSEARPFLTKLGATFPIDQAVTFFIAPPGKIIGQFKGVTNKNQLITALTGAVPNCTTSCTPGCCSVK